jgi:2,4-dienoyl-CoA reductase (NADPH2)
MEVIARTGAGMITNQGAYPDPEGAGKAYYRQLSIADDKYIPGFRKISVGAAQRRSDCHSASPARRRCGGIDLDHCIQPFWGPRFVPFPASTV